MLIGTLSIADLIYQTGRHLKPGESQRLAPRESEWLSEKLGESVLAIAGGDYDDLREKLYFLDPAVELGQTGDGWELRRMEKETWRGEE